jgi:hypothetical protein
MDPEHVRGREPSPPEVIVGHQDAKAWADGRGGGGALSSQRRIHPSDAGGSRGSPLAQAPIALYRAAGYREEGRLEGRFLLDGRYVDDVVMALVTLGGPDGPPGP